MPKNLKIGHYRIEEVNAPEGYTINKNYVEIAVDANTAYQMDSESGDAIITVDYENHPVKGKLTIYKRGEMLTGFKKDFVYEERYLKGAEFNVYAAENIFTPDYQKDENGNRQLIYAKDALVTTVTTGEDGKAVAENLPLGSYYVVEKTAPEGFVLNHDRSDVTFVYADQDTPVIEQEVTVGDDRQKVAIQVEKQDAENGTTVAGAVFGIYNKADIKADGKVIVKVDTLLQEMTSDRAIYLLATRKNLNNETYHIENTELLSFTHMGKMIQKYGENVVLRPYEDMWDYFLPIYEEGTDNSKMQEINNLIAYIDFLPWHMPTMFRFVKDKTKILLEKMGFAWKEPDQEIIDNLLDYGKQVGFFD